ncbi:DUF4255 domain-containing protein [Microcystis aeruginosa LEGE 11464]|jgi:hypothetical protein|uniref:DUF4255 domain-containing protein n=1 Tax=Microcystis TaxID=1125 RepID=UPI00187E3800|nr:MULTISPECIES: DUF4255 domain-containing protein [Microcystis]MBE9090188.1 DUF4255 domain-containing protein [Microcystis aeruginosa LEGE 11464]MCA2658813.1 DUF4255 domain-containing protein [Microcystis sp. M049S2]MCZ8129005.1 DUF4255 domain-containing protein [Microcystis sp. LE19-114.1B]
MIQDLDDTLKELLVQKVPLDPTAIDIKFEVPNKDDWNPKPTKPTINCFLYDIRENQELRSNERYLTRNGTTGTEEIAPTRIDLSYLITVWTTDVADEHQLLGNILKTLLSYPVLPKEVLKGQIVNQSLPLRAWVSQPERTPNAWDFWGALDGRMKAGISYMVTIDVEPFAPVGVRLVTEKVLKVEPK